MKILLIYSPEPRQTREWTFDVPDSCTVDLALAQCPEFQNTKALHQGILMLGVWGKPVTRDQLLYENDRLEIYRQLRVDPKVARRERFSRQGVKSAGLFSIKRAGAKAGY